MALSTHPRIRRLCTIEILSDAADPRLVWTSRHGPGTRRGTTVNARTAHPQQCQEERRGVRPSQSWPCAGGLLIPGSPCQRRCSPRNGHECGSAHPFMAPAVVPPSPSPRGASLSPLSAPAPPPYSPAFPVWKTDSSSRARCLSGPLSKHQPRLPQHSSLPALAPARAFPPSGHASPPQATVVGGKGVPTVSRGPDCQGAAATAVPLLAGSNFCRSSG